MVVIFSVVRQPKRLHSLCWQRSSLSAFYRKLGVKDICDAALNARQCRVVFFLLIMLVILLVHLVWDRFLKELLAPLNLEDQLLNSFCLLSHWLSLSVACSTDSLVVLLILTPIFMPIVDAAGIDPILVGVMVTLQMAIGSATPPFRLWHLYRNCDFRTSLYGSDPWDATEFFISWYWCLRCWFFFPSIALLPRDIFIQLIRRVTLFNQG